MAFVKVVRRSMRPEEWTDLRYGWIKRSIISQTHEITDLEIRDAHQESENHYTYLNDYRPLHKGDLYFTPDGTAFIRGKGRVPDHLDPEKTKIYLLLHTAAEMIVKINGRYAGGIDPNRDRILLNPWLGYDIPCDQGESPLPRPQAALGLEKTREFTIEIEGFNRSKPDDERNPDTMNSRGCRQIFDGAYIAVLDRELLKLYYDLTLFLDIAGSDEFDEDYRVFLNRELNEALNLMNFDDMTGAGSALQYIEEHIYRNTDFRSSGNVALVGHSHLDIAYYWRRMHVVQKNARTVLIQMRLMDEYPDFKYAHTQPYVYELLRDHYPELFSELKKKVALGQFEPIGAMYVEPDCNVPSAESLIRQCLYGQAFYLEEFGKKSDAAWLPDVFGNSWILPQILKKSGVKYFVSNKMSTWNDTNRFPHNNFIWKGIDGSRIYSCVPPTHFITWNMPSQVQENWNAYQDKEVGGQTLSMFGYGDGGSGATEEMVEMMHRFPKLSIMPKTEHVTAEDFLHRNFDHNEKLATWDGELYLEMHRGTFTTKSELKSYNRRLEFKLRTAELIAAANMLKNADPASYPAKELRALYKKLLLNQFHDILPGSHIHPVYTDAIKDLEELESKLDDLILQMSGNDGSHTYFNPLNQERNQVTFLEDSNGSFLRRGIRGRYLSPQAKGLSVCTHPAAHGEEKSDWFVLQNMELTTPFYQVSLNEDGSFQNLYDLALDREWVDGGFNKLHLYQDVPGMYDAWDILPNYKDVEFSWTVIEPLHLTRWDDTALELEVRLEAPSNQKPDSNGVPAASSPWTMQIRFFRTSPYIEVEHITDWNEKHKLVKAEFSTNVLSRELICDTSAGYIKRETHRNTSWQQARFEVCHHKWADFSESSGGIALINEGKYGLGVEENGMSLSLLRSNIRPDVVSDIGHHDFCYVILPHAGSHLDADINRKAFEYNVPLLKVSPDFSSAAEILSKLASGFEPLYLEAAKLSENGKYLIVRLSEQDGRRGQITTPVHVIPMNFLEEAQEDATRSLSYKPFEILCFGIPLDYAFT